MTTTNNGSYYLLIAVDKKARSLHGCFLGCLAWTSMAALIVVYTRVFSVRGRERNCVYIKVVGRNRTARLVKGDDSKFWEIL